MRTVTYLGINFRGCKVQRKIRTNMRETFELSMLDSDSYIKLYYKFLKIDPSVAKMNYNRII